MAESRKEHAARCLADITRLTGAETRLLDVERQALTGGAPAACTHCLRCQDTETNPARTALYGAFEAARWAGRYIFYCPCGFVFAALALPAPDGVLTDAALIGPLCMGQDVELEEGAPDAALVPALTPAAVTALSELAYAAICLPPMEGIERERRATFGRLNRDADAVRPPYPIDSERQLQRLVAVGDRDGALALLSRILQHICWEGSPLDEMQERASELLVLLSRATIEGGADVEEVFGLGKDAQRQIRLQRSADSLSRWVTAAAQRFISCVFDLTEVKHRDVLYKTTDYIRAHYAKRITLDQVAQHVYLSPAYLSRILKSELGASFPELVSRVRVQKSKELLADSSRSLAEIAGLAGFDEQSYFTKVFKKMTGVTPGQYRAAHAHS